MSAPVAAKHNISKKRKFVADGVFYAELRELLSKELAEDGFSGVEVRKTPIRTEIIIRATRTMEVLGPNGRRIRELTSLVQKRFGFTEGTVELYAERVNNRGLSACSQAESLKFKLLQGLAVRRACYSVLRYIMENGAKGAQVTALDISQSLFFGIHQQQVIVKGKVRAQRAKAMKFGDGYMVSSGHPAKIYLEKAFTHVQMRQGSIGIKVCIMLPHDPTGQNGVKTPQPDFVKINEPPAFKKA